MKVQLIVAALILCNGLLLSCKKSNDYTSKYEYPTILTISGSSNISVGSSGYTTSFYTYYLGPGVTYAWSVSSPADVDVTVTADNQTEASVFFKPGAAGKKITVTVKSSNGITGTKEVTVN